jgi:hypothetical protein
MKTRTMNTAVMMVILMASLMLFACKKTEPTGTKPLPEANQKQMLNKSFEESKQVIVAKVNGEAITMFSLLREMNTIAPQYLTPGQPATPEINTKIRKDALNTLITQELAVQEAIKRGMKVKPEAIDSEIKKIRASKGTEDAYQDYLGNQGLTENELRKTIEQDTLFEMIAAQEIDAKIAVTNAALRERYKERAGLKGAAHLQISFEAAKGMLAQKVRAEAGDMRMRKWGRGIEEERSDRIDLQPRG